MAESKEVREQAQPRLRNTTRNLVEAIMLDTWPRAGAVVDFGIDSQAHYEALSYGVREGEITPEALDSALGSGEKLTALARSAPSNPHREITFSTSWDHMLGRPESQEDGGQGGDADSEAMATPDEAKALFAEWREDDAARATQPLPSPSEISNFAMKPIEPRELGVERPQTRDLPSPGEIAREQMQPQDHGQEHGKEHGRGR